MTQIAKARSGDSGNFCGKDIIFDLYGRFCTPPSPQTTLEAAWRALQVPARLKLDFLQKYSTLERALDLPRVVQLMDIAGKLIPLREKVRLSFMFLTGIVLERKRERETGEGEKERACV